MEPAMRTPSSTPTDRELHARAIQVVNNAGVGLMCTVDEHGRPQARWMTTMARDGMKQVVTLTAMSTRKVAQLETDPRVCWVFNAPDFDDVVTLHGRVIIHRDALSGMQTWERLARAAQTYTFGSLRGDDPRLVTLETHVDRVEFISPRLEIFAPRDLGAP